MCVEAASSRWGQRSQEAEAWSDIKDQEGGGEGGGETSQLLMSSEPWQKQSCSFPTVSPRKLPDVFCSKKSLSVCVCVSKQWQPSERPLRWSDR